MEPSDQLKKTIESRYPCAAWHVGSAAVRSKDHQHFQVEIFRLVGHPETHRCYAWSWEREGAIRIETVLEIPPILSPESAVHAALEMK